MRAEVVWLRELSALHAVDLLREGKGLSLQALLCAG